MITVKRGGTRNPHGEIRHLYKGYAIKPSYEPTSGGYVLGGRHYREGGTKKYYRIFSIDESTHMRFRGERLSEAKEFIDSILTEETHPVKKIIYKNQTPICGYCGGSGIGPVEKSK